MKRLIVLAGLLLASTGQAANYHVTTSGSDSNGCTNATTDACRTPEFADGKLTQPGDTLYIHAGTYNVTGQSSYTQATIKPSASGASGSPITIRNWPGDTVILNGGAAPTGGIIGTGGKHWIVIEGLTIKGQIKIFSSNYCVLRNLDVSVGGDPDVNNTGFGDLLFVQLATGTQITNCRFHDNTIQKNDRKNSPLLMLYGAVDTIIEYNDFYNSVGVAIRDKDNPENTTVRYNFFYNNYLGGYRATNQNVVSGENSSKIEFTIHNNVFLNNSLGTGDFDEAGAVVINLLIPEAEIYNNTFVGNRHHIRDINNGAKNVKVWNNIYYGATALVYWYGWSSSGTQVGDWAYSNYNLVYGGTQSWRSRATTWTSLASFAAATGKDTASSTSNPNFVNAAGTTAASFKRSSYPADGRGGGYATVIGAYITGSEVIGYSGGEAPPDTTPPVASGGSPTGTLSAGTTSTTISWSTNEAATCRWGTSDSGSYAGQANGPTASGTSHSATYSGLTNGATGRPYVYCQDTAGNPSLSAYSWSFSVATPAGDTTPPTVTGFNITETSTPSKTVTIGTFTCSDAGTGVAGYYVIEGSCPATGAAGWVGSAPGTYTFGSIGAKTLRGCCKDGEGNVSPTGLTDTVTITSPTVSGGTVVFGSTADAHATGSLVDTYLALNATAYASNTQLRTYVWPSSQPANTIILQLDPTALDATAVIGAAYLYLYLEQAGGDAALPILAYRLTANPAHASATGETRDGSTPWTAASARTTAPLSPLGLGDVDTVLGSTTTAVGTSTGYKQFDVTRILSQCISAGDATCNVLLTPSGGASDSYRYFSSNDSASVSTQGPKLEVIYSGAGGGARGGGGSVH